VTNIPSEFKRKHRMDAVAGLVATDVVEEARAALRSIETSCKALASRSREDAFAAHLQAALSDELQGGLAALATVDAEMLARPHLPPSWASHKVEAWLPRWRAVEGVARSVKEDERLVGGRLVETVASHLSCIEPGSAPAKGLLALSDRLGAHTAACLAAWLSRGERLDDREGALDDFPLSRTFGMWASERIVAVGRVSRVIRALAPPRSSTTESSADGGDDASRFVLSRQGREESLASDETAITRAALALVQCRSLHGAVGGAASEALVARLEALAQARLWRAVAEPPGMLEGQGIAGQLEHLRKWCLLGKGDVFRSGLGGDASDAGLSLSALSRLADTVPVRRIRSSLSSPMFSDAADARVTSTRVAGVWEAALQAATTALDPWAEDPIPPPTAQFAADSACLGVTPESGHACQSLVVGSPLSVSGRDSAQSGPGAACTWRMHKPQNQWVVVVHTLHAAIGAGGVPPSLSKARAGFSAVALDDGAALPRLAAAGASIGSQAAVVLQSEARPLREVLEGVLTQLDLDSSGDADLQGGAVVAIAFHVTADLQATRLQVAAFAREPSHRPGRVGWACVCSDESPDRLALADPTATLHVEFEAPQSEDSVSNHMLVCTLQGEEPLCLRCPVSAGWTAASVACGPDSAVVLAPSTAHRSRVGIKPFPLLGVVATPVSCVSVGTSSRASAWKVPLVSAESSCAAVGASIPADGPEVEICWLYWRGGTSGIDAGLAARDAWWHCYIPSTPPWPASLLIGPTECSAYASLSRLLLRQRRALLRLDDTWLRLRHLHTIAYAAEDRGSAILSRPLARTTGPVVSIPGLREWCSRASLVQWSLRGILAGVDRLWHADVLDPAFSKLMGQVERSRDFSSLSHAHSAFLSTLVTETLLVHSETVRCFQALQHTAAGLHHAVARVASAVATCVEEGDEHSTATAILRAARAVAETATDVAVCAVEVAREGRALALAAESLPSRAATTTRGGGPSEAWRAFALSAARPASEACSRMK
jgi:hypothetical protein